VLIRYLWQLKTVVFLHWCLICTVLFQFSFNQTDITRAYYFKVSYRCLLLSIWRIIKLCIWYNLSSWTASAVRNCKTVNVNKTQQLICNVTVSTYLSYSRAYTRDRVYHATRPSKPKIESLWQIFGKNFHTILLFEGSLL
jgi:hypothetical protein